MLHARLGTLPQHRDPKTTIRKFSALRLTASFGTPLKHKIMTPTEVPIESSKPSRLEDRHYIRQKLYSGEKSVLQRYAELVIGRMDVWALLKYELLTCLLGPMPGALGLFLRKLFYPWLFRRIGHGVVFGRSVVIRNPERIVLGDRVVIDDYVVLDGRGGEGDEGLRVGDEVIINRGALIQAKVGTIQIGSHCDIGAETTIISQGANVIEDMVSIGGGSKIGGGLIQIQSESAPQNGGDPNDFAVRGQVRVSKGTVRIGAKSALGENVTVLDGAAIGSECIVGASAVIRGQIPDGSVVALQEKLVVLPRAAFSEETGGTVETVATKPNRRTVILTQAVQMEPTVQRTRVSSRQSTGPSIGSMGNCHLTGK